jgi:rhomboid protease GluP
MNSPPNPASPRKQSNAVLCPRCRKLVSADEPRCPHCQLARPGHIGWRAGRPWRLRDPRQLARILIGLNVVLFAISLLLDPWRTSLSPDPMRLLSPSNRSMLLLGAAGTLPTLELGRWWTLLSANYLHGSLLHILFNMLALRQLAHLAVGEFGAARTMVIYTLGGVAGFAVSVLAGVRFTIGASAAVCSLIGAVLYFGKTRGGIYGQTIFRQVGGWAVGLMLFGLLPGINNWGHGGGMAAGFLLAWVLGYRERRQTHPGHRLLAAACTAATLMVLVWAVGSGIFHRLQI